MCARAILGACVALLFVASGAPAQTALVPVPLSPDTRPVVRAPSPEHPDVCSDLYVNAALLTGFYLPVGAGVELLDDLHTGGSTFPCAFDFIYFKQDPPPVDATVTFYAGDPLDGPPGAVVAGPYALSGLPSGLNSFHVEIKPAAGLAPADLWVGVSFSTDDAGLVTAGPAGTGYSDDLFLIRPPGDYAYFGGNPSGDFALALYASGSPLA